MRIFFFTSTVLFLLVSCSRKEQKNTDTLTLEKVFVTPEVPTMLTSSKDRREYLALHYFDKFDFKDTTSIHRPKIGEDGIVGFITVLKNVTPSVRDSAIFLTLKKTLVTPKMYSYFWKIMDRYLNDPNSPMRDETIYISVCQSIGRLPKIDEVIASKASFNLQQALKNRVGETATDFSFTLESGKKMKMTNLKGEHTLLFFYEPDCPTCIKAKAYLRELTPLNNLIQQSVVTILAFYPQNNKELWMKLLPECSSNWINGYDAENYFTQKQPYDLPAFPSFYLLDKDKKILLKDAPIDVILKRISSDLDHEKAVKR